MMQSSLNTSVAKINNPYVLGGLFLAIASIIGVALALFHSVIFAYSGLIIFVFLVILVALITLNNLWRGTCTLAFLIAFQYYVQIQEGVSVSLVDAVGLGYVTGNLFHIAIARQFTLKRSPFHLLIFAYISLNLLFVINSPLTSDVLRNIFRAFLSGAVYLFVFRNLQTLRQLYTLLSLFVGPAFFSALFQIGIAILYPDMPSYLEFIRTMSSIGIYPPEIPYDMISLYPSPRIGSYLDPYGGSYGLYLTLVVPLTLALSLLVKRPAYKRLYYLASGFLVISLLLTLSRTSIYATVGGIVAMAVYMGVRLRKRWVLGITVVLLAFFALMPEYAQQRILSQTGDARSSSEGRFGPYIVRSLSLAMASPIIGGGTATMNKSAGGVNPHNGFLYDFQTKGIFSLITGLAIFALAFLELWRYRRFRKSLIYPVTLGLWGALAGFFLSFFATIPLAEIQPAALFFLFLAIIARWRYLWKTQNTAQESA